MTRTLEFLSPTLFTCIVLAGMLVYFIITTRVIRSKPKFLWIPALLLLLVSTALYFSAYWTGGVRTVFSCFFMSLSSALDLFLFKMNSTYGRFTDLFYLELGAEDDPLVLNRLVLLIGLYLCSIWTTSIMVMHFFARRLTSRLALDWLWIRRRGKGIHLFIGINPQSMAIAKSLPMEDKVVFVDLPVPELIPDKLSLTQIFKGVRSGSDQSVRLKAIRRDIVVLKARKDLSQCNSEKPFRDLGLGLLFRWTKTPETVVYLLSSSYTDNVAVLQKLHDCPCQLYCHAKREGLALRLELVESDHIHIIDSSFLSTKALKNRDELYPIHFVKIARDAEGQPLGYVESGFEALVCGFGEAGHGMLSFLYEFGFFPDKDKQPSSFRCTVVDPNMDRKEGEFRVSHPGIGREAIHFVKDSVGSESFWSSLNKNIETLNYIFINIGSDADNMKYALDMLEFAFRFRSNLERFIIVVKLDRPSSYQSLIGFFNQNYGGCNVIRSIGDISRSWTWSNISGADFRSDAQTFYAAYARATSSPVTWEEREKQIMAKPISPLAKKMELQRKMNQDFVNHFHLRVKCCLCPERLWKDAYIAANIPLEMVDGKHFTLRDAAAESVLEYLAVGEHLRWVASHEINGYRRGDAKQEDLKTHTDIRPYEELSEEVKHYDWVVVKTSLGLLGQ